MRPQDIPKAYLEIAIKYIGYEDDNLRLAEGRERIFSAKNAVRTAFDSYVREVEQLGVEVLGEGIQPGGLEERLPDPDNTHNAFYHTTREPTYNARYTLPTLVIAAIDTNREKREQISGLPFVTRVVDKTNRHYPDNTVALYKEEEPEQEPPTPNIMY